MLIIIERRRRSRRSLRLTRGISKETSGIDNPTNIKLTQGTKINQNTKWIKIYDTENGNDVSGFDNMNI